VISFFSLSSFMSSLSLLSRRIMSARNEVTIYDIARALKLSPSTISRALNDNPAIRRDTRTKILEKARDLGYRQNLFASSLRSQRTHVIGALVPQLNDYFLSNIVSGAEIIARQAGYSLVISQSMNDPKLQVSNIENFSRSRVDGLLITSCHSQRSGSLQNAVAELGIPTIVIEAYSLFHPQPKKMTVDYFKTAYDLTDHLAKKGCKRIVYVTSRPGRTSNVDLLKGYRKALQENGLSENGDIVSPGYDIKQSSLSDYRRLLSMTPRPDGILFSNDVITALSIPQFKKPRTNGSCYPSSAAFDSALPKSLESDFTSNGYRILELGEMATYLLICLIESIYCQ
jgi:LacI family transcriptional regulator